MGNLHSGIILKKLRTEKKYSQKDLATILDVAQNTISNWEKGVREPDHSTLIKLSDHFNVSIDYLLGRTNIRNPYETETIAAHHDGDDWTEEELEDIESFKEYVRTKRDKNN